MSATPKSYSYDLTREEILARLGARARSVPSRSGNTMPAPGKLISMGQNTVR